MSALLAKQAAQRPGASGIDDYDNDTYYNIATASAHGRHSMRLSSR